MRRASSWPLSGSERPAGSSGCGGFGGGVEEAGGLNGRNALARDMHSGSARASTCVVRAARKVGRRKVEGREVAAQL